MIEQPNSGLVLPNGEPSGMGIRPHLGVTYKISVWEDHAASVNPLAKPIAEQVVRNHMAYEGLDYVNNCAFASGSTFFPSSSFGLYVGLVNGAYSTSVSNYSDRATLITTSAPSGTPGTTPNYWSELTNFQSPTTSRQAMGSLTFSGSGSGGLIQVVTTGTAPSFTGGSGGGSVMGAFLIAGVTPGVATYGASGAASYYYGGAATGTSLISVAIGSVLSFSAAQVITVTVTISLQSA